MLCHVGKLTPVDEDWVSVAVCQAGLQPVVGFVIVVSNNSLLIWLESGVTGLWCTVAAGLSTRPHLDTVTDTHTTTDTNTKTETCRPWQTTRCTYVMTVYFARDVPLTANTVMRETKEQNGWTYKSIKRNVNKCQHHETHTSWHSETLLNTHTHTMTNIQVTQYTGLWCTIAARLSRSHTNTMKHTYWHMQTSWKHAHHDIYRQIQAHHDIQTRRLVMYSSRALSTRPRLNTMTEKHHENTHTMTAHREICLLNI